MNFHNFLSYNYINSSSFKQELKSVNIFECCVILANTKGLGKKYLRRLQIEDIVQDLKVLGSSRCVYYLNSDNHYSSYTENANNLLYIKNNIYLIIGKPEKTCLYKSLILAFLNKKGFFKKFKLDTDFLNFDLLVNIKLFVAVVLFVVRPILYQQILDYSKPNKVKYYNCILQKFRFDSFQSDVKTVLSCITLDYEYRYLNKDQKSKNDLFE